MGKAEEWRGRGRAQALEQAVKLELPSGMVVLARRPDPFLLASWGRLPLGLAAAARGEPAAAITDEEARGMADFMRDLLVSVCIEPRVSVNPGNDEIHPREIPEADWIYLVKWAMRAEEARALEGFRRDRADAGPGGDGEDVRGAPVRPIRDSGRGPGSEF